MEALVRRLSCNWGFVSARGIVAIIIGAMALRLETSTFQAQVALFGFYLIVDGLGMTVSSLSLLKGTPVATMFLVLGPLSILAGLVSPFLPQVTAVLMIYLWGAWAIGTGILVITSAPHLTALIPEGSFIKTGGTMLILVGLVLAAMPLAGLAGWAWLIGVYAIVYGLAHVGLAARLKLMADTGGYCMLRGEPLQPGITEPAARPAIRV